ncbi:MAG TPA: 50S ribosomal protein L10 [Ignavibacteriaceae bacterium]|mgnify:FL=1|jgi:large subunit ribosomal protein L10|nr:MAG: 50S ribosomal protein L10 [Ignavibacteria bacterium ADurb.Bin266]OQY69844.1 MAG: 50S ribosomal protein L10 [Ignavibacteriales bacterium UTCHB2]HQF43132.1 50S ribosomal protein L10 [Ignavibacteriaceae bacterium]HQI40388.1 50S ribosomal protein L10 [Ignavibacteriaceae bacterium]HQJ46644.1 50S ribosomal protein L10 [Ignavibacteriaceae bacterium]
MNKNEKAEIIAEAKELIQNSTAVFLTDYSNISVADITELRNQFRKDGVKYKVFKNTLFKRALAESGKFEKLAEHLEGMTGFAFASTNPVAPAKIIKKFNDTSQKFALKACYIETQYYDGSKLNQLASLPSKDELIAGIIGSLNSPASGIVGSISAVIRDLVSVIDEVSKKKAA